MWNIFQKWVNDGSNLKKGKSFQNMRNRPLINGPLEQLILEVFNPMELHLLLGRLSFVKECGVRCHTYVAGVVDKLIMEIQRNVFSAKKGKVFIEKFLRSVR